MGTAVGAVVLIALALAGAVLLRRHRRHRPTRVIDDPVEAVEPEKGSIINVFSLGPRMSDPKDIVIDKDERGIDVLLGEGSFGEVGLAQCWWKWKGACL